MVFDDIGYVVAQAPEHHIENLKMEAKAAGDVKKMRKMVKKKPPEGFVGWSQETFVKLQRSTPEPLVSRFQMSHGLLLNVLSRKGDACGAMRQIIDDSHETAGAKKSHKKRALATVQVTSGASHRGDHPAFSTGRWTAASCG